MCAKCCVLCNTTHAVSHPHISTVVLSGCAIHPVFDTGASVLVTTTLRTSGAFSLFWLCRKDSKGSLLLIPAQFVFSHARSLFFCVSLIGYLHTDAEVAAAAPWPVLLTLHVFVRPIFFMTHFSFRHYSTVDMNCSA